MTDLWVVSDAEYDRARSLIEAWGTSKMSDADLVWNRGCGPQAGFVSREGDKALRDLLLAHGYIMNGGMSAAHDYMTAEERNAAAAGYRYFGFEELATIIDGISASDVRQKERAEDRYYQLVDGDAVLLERFKAKFRSSPDAFAPVQR